MERVRTTRTSGLIPVLPKKIGIGIDFGMTYSGAAITYLMGGNFPHLEPIPIEGVVGKTKFPTKVFIPIEGNAIKIGNDATLQQQGGKLFSLFKRYLGTQWSDQVGTKSITAPFLVTQIFIKIKQDIDAFLRQHGFLDPSITIAYSFSYPGTWAPVEINDLKTAIINAGFKDFTMIDEPTATALGATRVGGHTEILRPGSNILVCDLGGGTFDLTDVKITPTGQVQLQMLAAAGGEKQLGMSNLDKVIALRASAHKNQVREDGLVILRDLVVFGNQLEQAWNAFPVDAAWKARLLYLSERLKIDAFEGWTNLSDWSLTLPNQSQVVLDKAQDLAPMVQAMHLAVRQSTERYLAELATTRSIQTSDIDFVIIGGGGSALPDIHQAFEQLLPRAKILPIAPEIATSLVQRGAAINALEPGIIKDPRVNTSYGIKVYRSEKPTYFCTDTMQAEREGVMTTFYAHYDVYLRRGDAIQEVMHTFSPLYMNAPSVTFTVLSGVEENPALNTLVGEVVLPLAPNTPVHYVIKVFFKVSSDGLIEVLAEDIYGQRAPVLTFQLELQREF